MHITVDCGFQNKEKITPYPTIELGGGKVFINKSLK